MKQPSPRSLWIVSLFYLSLLFSCSNSVSPVGSDCASNGNAAKTASHQIAGSLPTITSMTTSAGKAEGPVTGGTSVLISGTNFGSDTVVLFGATQSPCVTVQSTSAIIALTDAVFLSTTVSVTVKTGGQIVVAQDAFRYTPLVAFSSNRTGNFEVFTMAIDGSGVTQVTNNAFGVVQPPTSTEINASPVFSPDGRNILFETNRTGDFEIFIAGRTGTAPTNLTNHSGNDRSPSFSPDGNSIIFSSNRSTTANPTGDFEIFKMDKDGKNLKQLTFNASNDLDPSYSPDGSKIVFVSDRNGLDTDLFVMNSSDGNNQIQLTSNTDDDTDPTFSPDNSQILYASGATESRELFAIGSTGITSPLKLTTAQSHLSNPVFSPPFSSPLKILFAKHTANEKDEVFMMTCNGSGSLFIATCDEQTATNISLHIAADQSPSPSP